MDSLLHIAQRLALIGFLVSSQLSMGLRFAPVAIVSPMRNTRLVVVTLMLNFVLAPALAWFLGWIIPIDRGYATGLMLLGGAAGAPFLPKLAENARADVSLSAALVVLLTAGTIFFMPFALPLIVPGLNTGAWIIARPLLMLIVLPLVVGMVIRAIHAAAAEKAGSILAKIGNVFLLLLCLLVIILNIHSLLSLLGSGAVAVCAVYTVLLFAAGWACGDPKRETRGVLALATAARNFGTALVPAANGFQDQKVTLMIIAGAVVCIALAFPAAARLRKSAGAA